MYITTNTSFCCVGLCFATGYGEDAGRFPGLRCSTGQCRLTSRHRRWAARHCPSGMSKMLHDGPVQVTITTAPGQASENRHHHHNPLKSTRLHNHSRVGWFITGVPDDSRGRTLIRPRAQRRQWRARVGRTIASGTRLHEIPT